MRKIYFWVLAVVLSLAMLCGCGAQNDTPGNGETVNPPETENTTSDSGAQNDDTEIVPDESGDASGEESGESDDDGEHTDPGYAELSAAELSVWFDFFCKWENNGLLRFPYSDLENDPEQLAPYLHWLFYDIGEPESAFSDEEIALLSDSGLWLELDAFRLTREYINTYLLEKFNIPAEKTESLLDMAEIGTYLVEYDAWYIAHGDCAYSPYSIESGVRFADGTVKLRYFNDFLSVVQDNGEMDYVDAQMIVTLAQREDGTWYVVSHEIAAGAWEE